MYGLLFIALSYLLGSLPFAYLIARARGVDVFQIGTNNPGAANVFRMVGRIEGVIVAALDVFKGALPVLLAQWVGVSSWLAIAIGAGAILGHWYPVFLRFRGGAGLATAIGVTYAMMPMASLVATPLFLGVLYFRRDVGYAAASAYIAFFVATFLLGERGLLAPIIVTLPVLVLVRQRLLPTPGIH